MLLQGIAIETARRVVACVIGAAVLWQVAERAGRGDGEVVIHVTEPGVEVRIDDQAYPYDPAPGSPLICSLRPGNHTLSVTREGRTLSDETFTLESSGHAVLTARDSTRPTTPPKRRDPAVRW